MAFTWTDKMKSVGSRPELEEATRTAVIAATTFLAAADANAEVPHFNGSRFPVPRNAAAKAMHAECTKHLPAALTGVERETIASTAVAAAFYVQAHGGGEAGWGALAKKLGKPAR